jgi:hypothetical protein
VLLRWTHVRARPERRHVLVRCGRRTSRPTANKQIPFLKHSPQHGQDKYNT